MAKATLGGYALLDGTVQWKLTSGVTPSEAEFEMMPKDAEALTSGGLSPVTLKLDTPGADGVEITNLYVLQKRPAENANTSMVRVVDRRWFWPFVHVNHAFNIRRNVGVKRVRGGLDRPVLDPLSPKVRYAPWSINGSAAWDAESALKEVWKTVKKSEGESGGSEPSLSIDQHLKKLTKDLLPLEDMELADDGAAAIQRMMDYIPGAGITVDADGSVRVFSIANGADAGIMDALLPEQDGEHAEAVSYHRMRPREVRVYFAPEMELRLDYEEVGSGGTSEPAKSSDLTVDNVLPVPDHTLAGIYAQGTWLSVTRALSLWGAIPGGGKLTTTAIRKASVPFLDLWSGVNIAGLGDAKADWASRIAAVNQHYRRTYRINPSLNAFVRGWRAYRIATVDAQFGTRGPAAAYQAWSVVFTPRFMAVQLGGGGNSFAYAENIRKSAPKSKFAPMGNVPAAPIEVSVLDSDQGIVRLDFKADQFRTHEIFLPSTIDNIPGGELKAGGLIAWNSSEPGGAVPQLSAKHLTAFILTCIPAGPNNKKRLVELTRKPGDIAKLLPSTLTGGIDDAQGPPIDVFIGPGWETARIAWSDTDRGKIVAALGSSAQGPNSGDINSLAKAGLVINMTAANAFGISAASLDSIANAVAASVYAGYADRVEGSRTNPVTHAARIDGFIGSVIHKVAPNGVATSTATVAGQRTPLDLMSMMPNSTRKIILKYANSGKPQ